MAMLNPPHPGETIRELCLEPLGLTETVAADGLGVSRDVLDDLLAGRIGLTPEMALRLAMAFSTARLRQCSAVGRGFTPRARGAH